MSEHGLDLAAIRRKLGTHSIFGPSSAAMWALCSGSLIPNLMADDNANEDAAYGTVGHEVGEIWLKRVLANQKNAERAEEEDGLSHTSPWSMESAIDYWQPRKLIGTKKKVVEGSGRSFEILIDEEMMMYVRQYVVWCMVLKGDHYVEQRVDISQITPIEDQSGTADHFVCQPRRLIVTDLKMGRGIEVYAEWNFQGLLYALGVFWEWDWAYQFEIIEIRIAQPRRDHWDTWEIDREEILRFAEWIKGRAALAWVKDAPRTPGPKQCLWCKVKADCAANAAWEAARDDDCFDDLDADDDQETMRDNIVVGPDGTIHGVTYSVKEAQALNQALIEGKGVGLAAEPPNPYKLSTEALAKLLPHRKRMEQFFEAVYSELLARADAGEEVPGYKLVTGRAGKREWDDEDDAADYMTKWGADPQKIWVRKLVSPAQAEPLLRKAGFKLVFAKELLDSLVHRPAGQDVLVIDKDHRPELPPPGDLFDDLDDDDGL